MKKRYENMNSVANKHRMIDLVKWMIERRGKKKNLTEHIPMANDRDVEKIQGNTVDTTITWIGHATFLIQMNGVNIVTDPVWARRMGVQKRLTKPGYELSEMPTVDAVLISHGHYDHLDFASIKQLKGTPSYYVPIGLKKTFQRKGYTDVYEANWWDAFELQGVRLSFTPAQHWTRRTPWDTNTSHWGGWVIESCTGNTNAKNDSIYFAGDSGYFPGFKQIGERFDINAALMPIGAYEPEWFMNVSHMNPEDAIQAFIDLGADTFIPMHYGAYRLADDTGPEALGRLLTEWERLRIDAQKLVTLAIGETHWL